MYPIHWIETSRALFRESFLELRQGGCVYAGTIAEMVDYQIQIHTWMLHRQTGKIYGLSYPVAHKEGLITLQDLEASAHLFEREIADLFGVPIVAETDAFQPDSRYLVSHGRWPAGVFPMRKEVPAGAKPVARADKLPYLYRGITGEGGLQIPVGPVHAGIIEPGHFRFTIGGEPIEHLEIQLMYKHRGIEKIAEDMDANVLNLLLERVAGESTVAYAQAYAMLIEDLCVLHPPQEVALLRSVFLELERLYNFLDDMAGICVDVGYSYPAKRYQTLSESVHRLCDQLTNSRFMRNVIVPGGLQVYWNAEKSRLLGATLMDMVKTFEDVYQMTLKSTAFLDRIEETGMVSRERALELGMTGVAGRASGISYDVRHSFPYAAYGYPEFKALAPEPFTETIGGVLERYQLKYQEAQLGLHFIQVLLPSLPQGYEPTKPVIRLQPGLRGSAVVETVKGELLLYGRTGENNRFERLSLKTPSIASWAGLSEAVLGEIVPDFPLCNKSFNFSYSENDR